MRIDDAIVERVLNNQGTKEEAKLVSKWFASEEGYDFLSHYIAEDTMGLTEEDVEKWLNHEMPKKRMKERLVNQIHVSKKMSLRRKLIAAAVCIPFLFLSVSVAFLSERAGLFSEPQYTEVVAPAGEQIQVVLQDGTTVLLNSQTKLKYPQKFGFFSRTVTLSGEAYFVVAKERTRPFIVDLKDLKVEVTGTKFNIKSYENEDIWVTLHEGGVLLKDNRERKYPLIPGESAEFERSSGHCQISRPSDMGIISAWRYNRLNFYLTPLGDILKVLKRQYDTHFMVTDSLLLDSRFTLSTTKVNVEDVLKDLETVSHIVFKETEKGAYEVSCK